MRERLTRILNSIKEKLGFHDYERTGSHDHYQDGKLVSQEVFYTCTRCKNRIKEEVLLEPMPHIYHVTYFTVKDFYNPKELVMVAENTDIVYDRIDAMDGKVIEIEPLDTVDGYTVTIDPTEFYHIKNLTL